MTTYGYTNDAGEPIMSGEAYRFECALDDEARYEPDPFDDYYGQGDYDSPYDDDPDACKAAGVHGDDASENRDGTWTCDHCGHEYDYDADVSDDDGLTDAEADAMTLAGAGYGMDEDYGHFGDSDFFGEG